MKRLLFFFLLWPLLALAQAPKYCLPSDVFPGEVGSKYLFFETDKVEGRVGWCPTDPPAGAPAGLIYWRPIIWQWCLKTKCVPLFNPMTVVDRIRSAASKVDEAFVLSTILSVPLVKGSADETDFKIWWARACKALITPPYTLTPQPFTAGYVFPTGYCPAEPSGPPVVTWRTPATGNLTIFTYAAGRLVGVTARKALPNNPCNCDVAKAVVGPTTYCALSSGPPTEVAVCVKVTQ